MDYKITISVPTKDDTRAQRHGRRLFPVNDPENWCKVFVPLKGDFPRVVFYRSYDAALDFAKGQAAEYDYPIDDQIGGTLIQPDPYEFRTSDGRKWADLTGVELAAMVDEHKGSLH
jgi:hypothetical protein